MKKLIFLPLFLTLSLLSGCSADGAHDLELLRFEALNRTNDAEKESLKMHNFANEDNGESEDESIEVIDENESLSLKAVVKNEKRDSFIDMVVFSSEKDTYIVYNEGNGDYQCSSSTIFEDGFWVTNIFLEYDPKDIDGYLEISEISFLSESGTMNKALISEESIKKVNYHKHSYSEWEITTPPQAYKDGVRERKCVGCDHVDSESVDSLSTQHESDFIFQLIGNSHYVICGVKDANVEALYVPNEYDGLPVTIIYSLYPQSNGQSFQKLKVLYIPKNIISIGSIENDEFPFTPYGNAYNIFNCMPSLEQVVVDSDNKVFYSENGVLFSKDRKELVAVPASFNQKIYKVPNSVRTIYYAAFHGNTTIEEVVINSGTTRIMSSAFNCTSALSKIYLPITVETIDGTIVYCSEEGYPAKTFYCQHDSQPSGWADNWNFDYNIGGNNGMFPKHYCDVLWSQEHEYWNN